MDGGSLVLANRLTLRWSKSGSGEAFRFGLTMD